VLGQIADFRAREQDLKGKVKTAMIYPAVLATLAVGVLIFLLTFFIPTFSKMFADLGGSLPLLTQFIIALSKSVTQYGLFLLIAVTICTAMAWRSLSTDEGRRRLERGLLATPVLGKVIAHFALVRFCRMLGTLVGAGVPLVAALRVAREAVGNQTLSDTVQHAVDEVQRGTPLSRSLSDGTKLFPAAVIETLAVAEETGRLDKELVRIAAAFESDLDRQLRTLVAILEPVLLFVMAAIIGTVVIGMLLPIFNLQDLIK
jgi:type IV pilus assembly protein PilC